MITTPLRSRKLDSATTSRTKQRDLLKRKPRVRLTGDSDGRWLWAAYQMGMWREKFSGNLSQDAFEEKFLELALTDGVSYAWMLDAQGKDGLQPVGLILGQQVLTGKNVDREIIEPFVEWFPWATPRNQVEATAAFLKYISREIKIFVFAPEDAIRFWNLFVRFGMVRRGCKMIDYFSRGEHAMLYYTVNK